MQLKWGLIPSWSKDAKIAFSCLNARADTVKSKPAFRSAYKSRRCLVPGDGYYEWLRQGKDKLPYLYEFGGDELRSLAGLWESWKDPAVVYVAPIETFTLITTEASSLAAEIHDRMPVIVHAEERQAWLAGEVIPRVPYPTAGMSARRVSKVVNNPGDEGAECVAAT